MGTTIALIEVTPAMKFEIGAALRCMHDYTHAQCIHLALWVRSLILASLLDRS